MQKQDRFIEHLAILDFIGIVCGGRKDIGEAHVEEVKKLYKAVSGSKIMLPGGAVVYNQYGILRFLFAGEDGSEANNNENLQISIRAYIRFRAAEA